MKFGRRGVWTNDVRILTKFKIIAINSIEELDINFNDITNNYYLSGRSFVCVICYRQHCSKVNYFVLM